MHRLIKGIYSSGIFPPKNNYLEMGIGHCASISLLNEISSRTDNREDCDLIVRHCAKILTLKPKLWKKIQKGC